MSLPNHVAGSLFAAMSFAVAMVVIRGLFHGYFVMESFIVLCLLFGVGLYASVLLAVESATA